MEESSGLCKYKNIFGEPGKGVHSYRIGNIAVVDLVGTILIAYIFSLLTKTNFIWCLIAFLIIGEILHIMFCVDTPVTRFIQSVVTKNK